jgi:hypothetical protein
MPMADALLTDQLMGLQRDSRCPGSAGWITRQTKTSLPFWTNICAALPPVLAAAFISNPWARRADSVMGLGCPRGDAVAPAPAPDCSTMPLRERRRHSPASCSTSGPPTAAIDAAIMVEETPRDYPKAAPAHSTRRDRFARWRNGQPRWRGAALGLADFCRPGARRAGLRDVPARFAVLAA